PGFAQTNVVAGSRLSDFQCAVALGIFAQVVIRVGRRQASQHFALVGTRTRGHPSEVLVGIDVAAFQHIDPAAFQAFLIASDRPAATPAAETFGTRAHPGNDAQYEVQ